jgi:Family of unknown function (DUF6533)
MSLVSSRFGLSFLPAGSVHTSFLAAAAVAMLVYDYLLTIGDEVQYIWRPPITSIKVFYLILRYGVVIAEIMCSQGKSLPRNAGVCIHIASIALSGLIVNMTNTVSIYLSALKPRFNHPQVYCHHCEL